MTKLLWLLAAWLALPLGAWAATGDNCLDTLPSSLDKSGMHCKVLFQNTDETDASGTVVAVPITKTACHTWVYVRTAGGTSPTFDNWQVVALDSNATIADQVKPIIGVLDDDGTVTAGLCSGGSTTCGVTELNIFGAVKPYMQLIAGSSTGVGDTLLVYILQYECPNN